MHLRKRAEAPKIPLPVVVSTSGKFEGNDGKWSTFLINLNSNDEGDNGQDFRVLASTSSPITLVPGATEWCDDACAQLRGVQLRGGRQPRGNQEDGSWNPAGLYEVPIPNWFPKEMVVTNGNLTLRGRWGTTQVGLGPSSTASDVLTDRFAVSYLSEEFFLGFFGLANGVVGSGSGATKPTFLQQFQTEGQIATVSYGYTAGAWYRNNQNGAPGSLVLGGYDQSRVATPALSVNIPSTQNNSLIVGVPSMIYTPDEDVALGGEQSFTEGCGGFRANIDSTLPYLILPDCICDHFRDTYGLTYDETENLYFVNASSHERNGQQNGTIDFKIAEGATDSGTYTNIKLGYSAFDHQISSRTGQNGSYYFPIKKSKNSLYTLGRTFLQETYIIVDYDRLNLTVAPARYTGSTTQPNLQIIYNTTYNPAANSSSSGGLGPGVIAGTVVGIVVAFAIAGVIAFCWWRKRKNKQPEVPEPYETSQIDPGIAGQEIKYRRVSELTGSDLPMSPKSPVGDYYSADHKTVPPISEMSPDSPPVELYSPPAESTSDGDYFTGKFTRRGAQRDRASSGFTTPGTPIAELPGDEGQFHTPGSHFDAVSPISLPQATRGPSDTSLSTNIDERLADHKKDTTRTSAPTDAAAVDEAVGPKNESQDEATTQPEKERRPSHQRGLSDTTIASDSTAVSQPTPEERERWDRERESNRKPERPLSE